MSKIRINNLSFSYASSYENIFNNLNLNLDTDWKLGLIGRNGKGKTTFLKLLLGTLEYSGTITSSVSFNYFPFIVENKSLLTLEIMQQICPHKDEWEFFREISLLDVNTDVLYQAFNTLSNGEQTKIMLASLFLNENQFLLIDEPTNHLDLFARDKVASYLSKKKGFILVSHDRNFLDKCVDHILSINRSTVEIQKGNFSSYFINFENKQKSESIKNEELKKQINRLKDSSRQAAKWSDKVEATKNGNKGDKGFISHKASKMMKRSKNIENRKNEMINEKSKLLKDLETIESLKIHPLIHHKDTLVEFNDISIYFDRKKICGPISFSINQGDKVFINGKNGCGKTSLIKLLLTNNLNHDGKIAIANGLKISYIQQDISNLKGYLDDFSRDHNLDITLFKTILRKLDFSREQFDKKIEDLSDGKKKKVLIAKSLSEQAHLYIRDEPLNYIDIFSRIQLENLIKEFNITMLLIEHDAKFMESIATKIITITPNV